MKDLKPDSSKTLRQPLGEVTELPHVRIALYEMLHIAGAKDDDDSQTMARLLRGIIRVTTNNRTALAELTELPPVAAFPAVSEAEFNKLYQGTWQQA
jgi:hypothetical protein